MANKLKLSSCLVTIIGIISGTLLLLLGDKILQEKKTNNMHLNKLFMLAFSITLHNIPEGLAIGVAFGSLKYNLDGVTLISAATLALGIGIQNFPEGSAISLPIRSYGYSRKKAFLLGVLSAVVEPICSVIGAILVIKIRYLLPFLLIFAAGAMLYVIIKDLIPESLADDNKSLMTSITILGFLIMMILDISLG